MTPGIAGDTLLYTGRGLLRADELFARGILPHIQTETRLSPIGLTSTIAAAHDRLEAQEILYLETTEGYALRLSPDCRVMTASGWLPVRDLTPGEKIFVFQGTGGYGTKGTRSVGQILGWLVGDGTLRGASKEAVLSFFGEKRDISQDFADKVNVLVREHASPGSFAGREAIGVVAVKDRDEDRVTSTRLWDAAKHYGLVKGKLCVPESVFKGSQQMQRGFLEALFSSDGHVNTAVGKGASVRLTSVSLDLLRDVQRLLLNFGVATTIFFDRRKAGERALSDNKGGKKIYQCQASHDLSLSRDNLTRYQESIGFLLPSKTEKLALALDSYKNGPTKEDYLATVKEVRPDGTEAAYRFSEPVTCSYVANGIVVGA